MVVTGVILQFCGDALPGLGVCVSQVVPEFVGNREALLKLDQKIVFESAFSIRRGMPNWLGIE
jgi:hypothetical protein